MNKTQKGITLVALIITIIVMLILVAVTINLAINGGLFDKAKDASEKTQVEADREELHTFVIGAYTKTGLFDGELFKTNLEKSGWTVEPIIENDKTVGYTCTSQKGNVFTVDTVGNIKYVGRGEGGGVTPVDPEGPDTTPDSYAKAQELTQLEGTNVSLVAYNNLSQEMQEAVENGYVYAVLEETVGVNKVRAVVPVGYKVSNSECEITKGLVIYDGESNSNRNNEFVWIPASNMKVATLSDQYVVNTNYKEPKVISEWDIETEYDYDTQDELNAIYGNAYFTYPGTDFAYEAHYKEMAESVNKYGGFYIGRYETTVDGSNKIGSKLNENVLVANTKLGMFNNKEARWWGLYYAQRHANVSGNRNKVQTNMIWGQQWDKMIEFFGNDSSVYAAIDTNTYDKPSVISKSGQATYTNKNDNTDVIKDEILNIYDLRMNTYDWTAEAWYTSNRCTRGGTCADVYISSQPADSRGASSSSTSPNLYGANSYYYRVSSFNVYIK